MEPAEGFEHFINWLRISCFTFKLHRRCVEIFYM